MLVAIGELTEDIERQRPANTRLGGPGPVLILIAKELRRDAVAALRRGVAELIADPYLLGGVADVEELARAGEAVDAVQNVVCALLEVARLDARVDLGAAEPLLAGRNPRHGGELRKVAAAVEQV